MNTNVPNRFDTSTEGRKFAADSPSEKTALKKRDTKLGSGAINIVYILFHCVENVSNNILKYLHSRDMRNLRAVNTEMCSMLFKKGLFNLSVTPERLQQLDLRKYPRLYPRVYEDHLVSLAPVPVEACVQHESDLQAILKDSRLKVKSVIFKGVVEDLKKVCDALPPTASTLEITTKIPHGVRIDLSQYEQLKIIKIKEPTSDLMLPKGVTLIDSSTELPIGVPPRVTYANEGEYGNPSEPKLIDTEKLPGKDTESPLVNRENTSRATYDNQSKRLPQGEDSVADRDNAVFNSFLGVSRLPVGNIVIGDRLGSGAFGDVYRGEWGGRALALKKIDFEHARRRLGLSKEEALEALDWEMSRLSTVNHPNLVQFYGIYQHESEGYTYLVTEFCEGGDLRKELDKNKNIPWSKRWQWALQIVQALAYLHKEGVLHRDLKAENILLDRTGRAKLADLGVAQVDALLQASEAQVVAKGLQDVRYIAPENVDEPTLSTKATDIYALGLVLWEIASGEEPDWTGGEPLEENRIPRNCPQSFKELILKCCNDDPTQRPSAEELAFKLEVLGAEFDPDRHLLIKACEQVEELLHSKRKEGLAYVAPFVTASEVKETIESYWSRIEASKEKAGNPPLQLKETFENFIKSPGSITLLLLGEAGLGKTLTTYLWADELLSQWWAHINKSEKAPEYFPLFIRPFLSTWSHDSIEGAFLKVAKEYNLPSNLPFLVFVDGYDELSPSAKGAGVENLVKDLGLDTYPQAKLIVTCRPNTVEASELQRRFSFNSQLETRYFLPFKLDQLLTYLKTQLSWNDTVYEEYQQKLQNAESVKTVFRNPFVLHLMKESWETVSKKSFHELSRYQIYEDFIEHILKTQQSLLSSNLQKLLQRSFPDLVTSYQAFASTIAFSAFQKNNIALDWKDARELSKWARLQEYTEIEAKKSFSERQELLKAELENASTEEKNKFIRRSLLKEDDYVLMTLKRVEQFEAELPLKLRGGKGAQSYEYTHKSFFEYFMAKRIILLKNNQNRESIIEEGIGLLCKRPIQEEKEVLNFFEEGWGHEEVNLLKEPLFEIIKASRNDNSEAQSAANAATLLAAAHVPFSGRDLSGVRIKGANLNNGVFSNTCFYKADLQDVTLHRAWLDETDLREANLVGVDFGEFPSLKLKSTPNCVSYSKDGKQLAVGFRHGHIEIYKREEKAYKHIKTIQGHVGGPFGEVTSVTYSPDGKQLVSGSADQTVKIWEADNLAIITQLKGYSNAVWSVTYSPDGKQLASVSGNYWEKEGQVWIWDTNLQTITQLKGHTGEVHSVTYSPDGKQLASGGQSGKEGEVWIWDTSTLQAITQLKGHSDTVTSVMYSPDGKQLASASRDSTVKIWDAETLQVIAQLKGHTGFVYSVTYSPNGKHLISAGSDRMVKIWDVETLQAVTKLKGHTDDVTSVTYSPDGKQLVTTSFDKTVGIWDTATFQAVTQLKGHSGEVTSVKYSPDGKQLASASSDQTVGIWNIENLKAITQLKGHSDGVRDLTYSVDGKQLASASWDKSLIIWDTGALQAVTQLKGHTSAVNSVTYSPDGKQLVSASLEEVVIWDVGTLQAITQLERHSPKEAVWSVTYSPDGEYLSSGNMDRTVRIWDMGALQVVTHLAGHSEGVTTLAYSPDGKQLASAGEDETVKIWDMEALEAIAQLEGHSGSVNRITYSPDGKQLASASGLREKAEVWIWDMETLQVITQLKGHLGMAFSVTYSPDGKQLASGSNDNAIFLWAQQISPCLPGAQENWQLIRRFEMGHRLSAEGAFLKGAKISESNLELLKQKGANDEEDLPHHTHFSSTEDEAFK